MVVPPEKRRKVYQAACTPQKKSQRQIATESGVSKSSVRTILKEISPRMVRVQDKFPNLTLPQIMEKFPSIFEPKFIASVLENEITEAHRQIWRDAKQMQSTGRTSDEERRIQASFKAQMKQVKDDFEACKEKGKTYPMYYDYTEVEQVKTKDCALGDFYRSELGPAGSIHPLKFLLGGEADPVQLHKRLAELVVPKLLPSTLEGILIQENLMAPLANCVGPYQLEHSKKPGARHINDEWVFIAYNQSRLAFLQKDLPTDHIFIYPKTRAKFRWFLEQIRPFLAEMLKDVATQFLLLGKNELHIAEMQIIAVSYRNPKFDGKGMVIKQFHLDMAKDLHTAQLLKNMASVIVPFRLQNNAQPEFAVKGDAATCRSDAAPIEKLYSYRKGAGLIFGSDVWHNTNGYDLVRATNDKDTCRLMLAFYIGDYDETNSDVMHAIQNKCYHMPAAKQARKTFEGIKQWKEDHKLTFVPAEDGKMDLKFEWD